MTIEEVQVLIKTPNLHLGDIREIQQFVSGKLIEIGNDIEKMRRQSLTVEDIYIVAERVATIELFDDEDKLIGVFAGCKKPPTNQKVRDKFLQNKIDEIIESEKGKKNYSHERWKFNYKLDNEQAIFDYWKIIAVQISNMAITEATIEKHSGDN